MSTNYPTALDTSSNLPNPSGSSFQNNPDHGQQHSNANDAIKALETKLGIGNTAPSGTGLLLVPTGPGTTAWTQITSAQLLASITDETGSGSAVFANTPTLITPKVDTINENTVGNGVTVGGVNLKAGFIPASAIATNGITADKLATSVIKLGTASITSGTITHTTTETTIASVAVTVPSGGRDLELVVIVPQIFSSVSGDRVNVRFKEGTTVLQQYYDVLPASGAVSSSPRTYICYISAPAAGSHTYVITGVRDVGTGTVSWYNDNTGASIKMYVKAI